MRSFVLVVCFILVVLSFWAQDRVSGSTPVDQPGNGAWYCSDEKATATVMAAVKRGNVNRANKLLTQYVSNATCGPGEALERGTPVTIKVALTEVVVCALVITGDGERFIAYYPQTNHRC